MAKTLVNVYVARDLLGVSLRTVYYMVKDGRLTQQRGMITVESIERLRGSFTARLHRQHRPDLFKKV